MSSKLYFYYSVMNSGKSAHIIMQVHNLRELGYNVLVLKPKIDTRDLGFVKSRALKVKIESELIDDSFDIFTYAFKNKPNYIFVDEVNFLTKNDVESLAKIVDELKIPVFAYGLLVDYKGLQFEGSKRMIELADSIRELKSPCLKCGKKATMHLRKINNDYVFDGESIQVGDMDSYETVCRTCYNYVRKNRNNK